MSDKQAFKAMMQSLRESEGLGPASSSDFRSVLDSAKKQTMSELPQDEQDVLAFEDTYVDEAIARVAENFSVLGIDMPVDKDTAAFWAGLGHKATKVYRGVKQFFDVDTEELKQEEAFMRDLANNPEVGSATRAGQVTGEILEPVAWMVPWAKGLGIAKSVGLGAGIGAGLEGISYVDEEGGETRLGNMQAGLGYGALGGGVVWGIGKIADNIFAAKQSRIVDDAENAFTRYEKEVAEYKLVNDASWQEAHDAVRKELPDVWKQTQEIMGATGEVPNPIKVARNYHMYEAEEAGLFPLDSIPPSQKGPIASAGGVSDFGMYISVTSDRVKAISARIFGKLRKFEGQIKRRPEVYASKRQNFADHFETRWGSYRKIVDKSKSQFSTEQTNKLNYYLVNGKFEDAKSFILETKGQAALDSFEDALGVVKELGDEMFSLGIIPKKLDNYWPRVVSRNNIDDFLKEVTKSHKHGLPTHTSERWKKHLKKLNRTAQEKRGYKLTPTEETDAFQKWFFQSTDGIHSIGFAKGRKLQEVKEEWIKYYENPINALDSYIHRAVKEIETAKFMGKDAYQAGLKNNSDIDGMFNLRNAMDTYKLSDEFKKLDPLDQAELEELIKLRFGNGIASTNEGVRAYKNFVYTTLLANPIAAITQLGDLGVSMYKNGVVRTLKAVYKKATGKSPLTVREMGLEMDRFAEWEDLKGAFDQVWLDRFMTLSGFKFVDELGKETFVAAALDKAIDAVKKPQSAAYGKWASKQKQILGIRDFHKLRKDLERYAANRVPENMTEEMRLYLFSELSDIQPISLSEMPTGYLRSNIGRTVFTLKTFMMKQLSILQKDAVNKIAVGAKTKDAAKVAEGLKNLTAYIGIVGSMNLAADTVKDLALGREDLESLDDSITDAGFVEIFPALFAQSLKIFGLSEYTLGQMDRGGPEALISEYVVPPIPMLGELWSYVNGGLGDKNIDDLARYAPLIGRFWAEGNVAGIEVPKPSDILPVQEYAEGGMVKKPEGKEDKSGGVWIKEEDLEKWKGMSKEEILQELLKGKDVKEFAEGGLVSDSEEGEKEPMPSTSITQEMLPETLPAAPVDEGKVGMTHTDSRGQGEVEPVTADSIRRKIAEYVGLDYEDIKWAQKLGESYGINDTYYGRGDAARHAALGWLASRTPNPNLTYAAIQGKEGFDLLTLSKDAPVDFRNNQKGFNISAEDKKEAEEIIKKMVEENSLEYLEGGYSTYEKGEGRPDYFPPEEENKKKGMKANKPEKLEPGVYQDDDGMLFKVTEDGDIINFE